MTPTNLIAAIRQAVPDADHVFTQGRCYELWLIVRTVYPDAKPLYDPIVGHVYIKHEGAVYDITGKHVKPPPLEPMDVRRLKPHRWKKRDNFSD